MKILGHVLRYSLVSMSLTLISGPYFIKLVRLPVLSILSLDFIYLSPGPDFIKEVRVWMLSILSPGPDLMK